MRIRNGFFIFGLLVTAGACSEGPIQPETAAGSYVLTGAAGLALPAVVFDDTIRDPSGDFHLKVVATSGVLELSGTGGYEQRVEQTPYVDGQPQPRLRRTDRGAYTVDGDSLRFESSFIQNVRFTGVLRNGEIHLVQDLSEEGAPVVYQYKR